jgi:rfaE bifunctional protein nucleotidyltransferase chain/domain
MRQPSDKIIAPKDVETKAAALRDRGVKIVSTNGCFDLLHLGHLNYLAQARGLGEVLWIGLNADASVRRIKGPQRPLQDEHVRLQQLAALEAVDFVTLFEEDTPETFLQKLRPAVHVKGGDYRPEDLPERAVVEAGGGKVEVLAFTPGFSTTGLIAKLKSL